MHFGYSGRESCHFISLFVLQFVSIFWSFRQDDVPEEKGRVTNMGVWGEGVKKYDDEKQQKTGN